MDTDFKTFDVVNSHKYLIADGALLMLAMGIMLKERSKLSIGFIVVIAAYVIFDVTTTMYKRKVVKDNNIHDLAINCEEMVVSSGFPVKKTEIKFSEVESMSIPKWDKYIKIKLKSNIRYNINLGTYSVKDVNEIKRILNEIQFKDDDKDDKSKTYHNVNGKCYIK